MAIKTYLKDTLKATHLLMLENNTHECAETLLTADASGTTTVTVADGSKFAPRNRCQIVDDDTAALDKTVSSVTATTITFTTSVPNTYTVAQNAKVTSYSASLSTNVGTNFNQNAICNGVLKSFQVSGGAGSSQNNVGELTDCTDINLTADIGRSKSIICWFMNTSATPPSVIYKEGGNSNNFAIVMGVGKVITIQGAQTDSAFIIAQSSFLAQIDRAYFVTLAWKADSGANKNTLEIHVNGVLQESVEKPYDTFNAHSGAIVFGNVGSENPLLKSYNGATMAFIDKEKKLNMWAITNAKFLTVAESREAFERTVLPYVTIVADTVANQQTALDLLIGNTYTDKNLAIRVIQATGVNNYRLFLDDITFDQDSTVNNIAVQYVGANTLTLENCNDSNCVIKSTPDEVDIDGTAPNILTGGGSITMVEDVKRMHSVVDLSDETLNKIVFMVAGTYSLTNCTITEVENVSGGNVILNLTNSTVTTNTGPNITVNILTFFTLINVVVDSRYWIYDTTNSTLLTSGTAATSTVEWTGNNIPNGTNVTIRVRKSSSGTKYRDYETQGTVTGLAVSVSVSQNVDSNAN